MPRLNSSTGDAICGIGMNIVSINGVTPAAMADFLGGMWSWMSETVAMGQGTLSGGPWRLYTYDQDTGILAEISEDTPKEANDTKAGGGAWAAWLAGDGVRTSNEEIGVLESAGLEDMSDLGLIALTATRGVGPLEVYLASSGALVRQVPTILTNHHVRVRGGALAYQDMEGWHVISVSSGRTVNGWVGRPDIYMVIPFLAGLRLWVAEHEQTTDQWAIRAVDGARGFIVPAGTVGFWPDIVSVDGTTARLAWSTTQGEGPDHLRILDIDLGDGTTTLYEAQGGSLVSSEGPTLAQTRFDTTAASRFYPPVSHAVLDRQRNLLMSQPWQAWARTIGAAVAGAQTSIAGLPAGGSAAAAAAAPAPSPSVVALDGTATAGTSPSYARGDHKHADANRPTDDQKAALAGTHGSPSGANRYVTDSDPRLSAAYYMSPLTTGGDPATAELIFAPDGDVVMVPEYF